MLGGVYFSAEQRKWQIPLQREFEDTRLLGRGTSVEHQVGDKNKNNMMMETFQSTRAWLLIQSSRASRGIAEKSTVKTQKK